jgi:lipopolysaccharide/colanic/teichoic acid biosynthesis glycosyltransferase
MGVAGRFPGVTSKLPKRPKAARCGRGGTSFFLYKFRILHSPFDGPYPKISACRGSFASSAIAGLMLPPPFNALVGEMSLIGPRPLLPEDQPTNSKARLLVWSDGTL